MISAVVFGNTFITLIGVICVFLSIVSAIYAIRDTINQNNKRDFKNFAFLSATLGAIAYLIMLFILDV